MWVTFMIAASFAFSPNTGTHFCYLKCLIELPTCSKFTNVSLITVSSYSCSNPEHNLTTLRKNTDGLRTENRTHFNS